MLVGQPSDGDHRQMDTQVWTLDGDLEFISVQAAAKAKAQEGTLSQGETTNQEEWLPRK